MISSYEGSYGNTGRWHGQDAVKFETPFEEDMTMPAAYAGAFFKSDMGVFTWRGGTEDDGEMKCNTIRGKGVLKRPHANGNSFNSYDGDIVDGVRHGVGTFVKRNSRGEEEVTYEGECRDGLRHGQGRLKVGLAEVEWYEGSWHKGIECGWHHAVALRQHLGRRVEE